MAAIEPDHTTPVHAASSYAEQADRIETDARRAEDSLGRQVQRLQIRLRKLRQEAGTSTLLVDVRACLERVSQARIERAVKRLATIQVLHQELCDVERHLLIQECRQDSRLELDREGVDGFESRVQRALASSHPSQSS